MAAFLLWNVHRKPLDGLVQSLVRQHQIDVVLLVEYAFGESQLSDMLQKDGLVRRKSDQRFGVFVRQDHKLSRLRYALGRRAGIWKWTPPSGQDGLIVLLHGLDRRNYGDSDRRIFFRRIADAVQRAEAKQQHQRTIIAGDFNAQPFESAVVDSDGLHAIGVKAVGDRTGRMVHGTSGITGFFYNPMWRAYGQQGHWDAGAATYYRLRNRPDEVGWYMLDQVVLRPQESARFPEDQLRIIDTVGAISLLDANGLPDWRTASDHLPVAFHWNL